jgi:hypothetical protein
MPVLMGEDPTEERLALAGRTSLLGNINDDMIDVQRRI